MTDDDWQRNWIVWWARGSLAEGRKAAGWRKREGKRKGTRSPVHRQDYSGGNNTATEDYCEWISVVLVSLCLSLWQAKPSPRALQIKGVTLLAKDASAELNIPAAGSSVLVVTLHFHEQTPVQGKESKEKKTIVLI